MGYNPWGPKESDNDRETAQSTQLQLKPQNQCQTSGMKIKQEPGYSFHILLSLLP